MTRIPTRVATAALAVTLALVAAPAHAGARGRPWPPGLEGPFTYERVHQPITMDDGVVLDGWLWLPDLPDGVKAPTVLVYWPYQGNLDSPGNDPAAGSKLTGAVLLPADEMARRGYAIAMYNVRGTGDSGGCYDWFGSRTGRDGAAVVDWIAAQPWSNERVGMIGLSEDATATWATAVERPQALKAIVPISGVPDRFLSQGTPNGLMTPLSPANIALAYGVTSAPPSIYREPGGAPVGNTAGITRDRACDDVRSAFERHAADPAADQRDAAYWGDRRHTDRFGDVTAAVLSVTGFGDTTTAGFGAEAVAWSLLRRAPKAMIQGQWDHVGAIPTTVDTVAWPDIRLRWFDYWLKGIGPKPDELGTVQYQTEDEAWHRTTSWPPADSADEVLYLGAGGLQPAPDDTSREFVSITRAGTSFAAGADATACDTDATSALFLSAPLEHDAVIAGAPFAYLRLSSSQEGGQIGVNVFEVPGDFSCTNDPLAVQPMTWGAADLRFYDGSFEADPFPSAPTDVRIDMESTAQRIDAGNRIAVWMSAGDVSFRTASPYTPTITVHGESHVVFPVVGTVGGSAPTLAYPPRPNLPAGRGR